MPAYFQKPENALKRANEFIEVGKKEEALAALRDVIKSKKHRTLQKIHEPILRKYLELCVDLRQSHEAKEGMYQYKLISQQVNVASLEDVVRYFLTLSEKKAEAAQEESREKVDVEDLEEIQTPESILLSFVSGEVSQDRVDRLMVTPWVKFLWEAYRNVLELLRNNARVEKLYHEVAQQAFKFCLKYTRRTEFRKLCDNLRNHLQLIIRHQGQTNAVNLSNADSIQMHLETRLAQLDSAIAMELWQEAFKAVEDIYNLMQLAKKTPKPQLLANYYQKTALVFWKSRNYLYHAAALQRLFVLCREQKKTITPEEQQKMASRLLVAVLSIPLPLPQTESDKYLMFDEVAREKSRRLATLLSLPTVPTRKKLVGDLIKLNVLDYAMPEIKNLYQWLEVDFNPLELCKDVEGVTNILSENEELSTYVKPLQDITIVKLLNQVSQVYQTISIPKLLELASFTDVFNLEKVVVEAAKRNNLQVLIDHRSNSISFRSDLSVDQKEEVMDGPYFQSLSSEKIRSQLIVMSQALHKAIQILQPPEIVMERAKTLEDAMAAYEQTAKREHQDMLKRKQMIEKRKEHLENLNIKKEKEEQAERDKQRDKAQAAERQRLEAEATMREEKRKQRELQEIEKKQAMEKIMALKKTTVGARALKNLTEQEIEEMDADDIMARQVEQLDREKKETQHKLRLQEKRVDHFERAKRLEEIPLLVKQYEEFVVADKEFWDEEQENTIKNAIREREKAMEMKNRLLRILDDRDAFLEKLAESRKKAHEAKNEKFEEELNNIRKERLNNRRLDRIRERKVKYQREKEEAKRKAEEERLRKEREEKERIAREENERKEAEERERKAKLDEIERKKREKEMEIERREEEARKEKEREMKVGRDESEGGSWRPPGQDGGDRAWRRGDREMDRDRPGWGRDDREGGRAWGRDDRGDRGGAWGSRDQDRDRDRFARDRDMDRDRDGGRPAWGRDRDQGRPWGRDQDRDRGGWGRDRDQDRGGWGRDQDRGGPRGGGYDRGDDRDRPAWGRDRDRDGGDRGSGPRDGPPPRGGGFRDDGDSSWRGSRGPPRDDRGPPPRAGGDRYSDDRGPPRRPDDREGGGRWRNRDDERDPGPWRRDGPSAGRSEGRSWSAARKGGSGVTSSGERDRKPEGDGSDGWTTVGGR
ncbi:eukaryotic translation initiation factor 3 subunit A-like [Dendronephthya gigantea]|uniref:eukaryotic translation initiation factor 3 subunit A-like n=1 Tax=Dendronephthya gigantea TaxID=151771 RepID=UPI001069AADC|nr:eukaryotic translation initiation factor 3 subunit A-like [Dendronephthya gigantea]